MKFHLESYLGRWFEIGRYPLIYEEGCTGAMANYEYLPNRKGIKVTNTCLLNNQPIRQDTGFARLTIIPGTFLLKFDRFGPDALETPYVILWTDYQHAFVGNLDLDYYYILSRKPILTLNELDFIYDKTIEYGFDPKKVLINPDIQLNF